MKGRTAAALLMTLVLLGAPALAVGACTHPTICDASALLADRACCGTSSCTLDGTYTVSGQSCDLDFGARNVTLSGQLAVGSGIASIEARSLTLRGPLTALGTKGHTGGTITITLSGGANPALRVTGSGSIDLSGYAGLSGNGGGTLTVQADGPLAIAGGGLDANGLEATAGGGTFTLTTTSGGVTIDGDVLARGGLSGDAGQITIVTAGDLLVASGRTVSVSGGGFSEGSIDFEVGGNATFQPASVIEADGLAGSGAFGGGIQIFADAISVLGNITVNGAPGGDVNSGGDGGDIQLEARTGKLLLQRNTGGVLADAASGGGGGSIFLRTDALTDENAGTDGTIQIAAPVSAQGLGTTDGASGGGIIEVEASGDLLIQRPINATGAGGGSSEVDLTAIRDVTIDAPVTGTDPSAGGDLSIQGHDITVRSNLLFQAPPSTDGGDGGSADLVADNDILIAHPNTVDVSGAGGFSGGEITLLAGRNILIEFGGSLQADGGGVHGPGGDITVRAGKGRPTGSPPIVPPQTGDLTINGEIDARGASTGPGSNIQLEACAIALLGTVDSRGDAASQNTLTARESLNLGGEAHLFAATSNLLQLGGTLAKSPLITVAPDPTVEQHAPCKELDVPAGCLMPCPTCGNHVVEFPETCDPATASRCAAGCAHCQAESCTADVCVVPDCDPLGGCLDRDKPNGAPCDDTNVCNGHEVCQNRRCLTGTDLACDDQNPCTADTCDPAAGCTHTTITGPEVVGCDDGNPCNGVETCGGGTCSSGTPPVCDPPTVCDRATGICDKIPCTPPDVTPCDDGNPCTTDTCVVDHCERVPLNDTPCPDSDACNGAETCHAGVCTAGPPPNCDDGHFCTTDSCDPALSCQNDTVFDCCELDSECKDLDPCTTDACTDHRCTNLPIPNCCQTTADCDDGNACNGSESCAADRCTPGTNLPDNTPCDDDTVCNGREQCTNGSCLTATAPPDCVSADVCVDEFCDPAVGCVTHPIAGCCHNDGECDDQNACTLDACSSDTHTCSHVTPDQSCRPCQLDTDCDPEGRCVGQACADTKTCTVVPLPCDDHNTHTFDRCTLDAQLAPICAHPCRDDQACDDAKACNGVERCQSGACVPGTAPDCDDHDLCTDDGCAEARSGCFHTPKQSFASVSCRLDGVDGALTAAVPADLSPTLKAKLQKLSGKASAKLLLAIAADQAGNAKKRLKMLRSTAALVKSMEKTVTRGVARQKISATLGDTLQHLLGGGLDALAGLLPPT